MQPTFPLPEMQFQARITYITKLTTLSVVLTHSIWFNIYKCNKSETLARRTLCKKFCGLYYYFYILFLSWGHDFILFAFWLNLDHMSFLSGIISVFSTVFSYHLIFPFLKNLFTPLVVLNRFLYFFREDNFEE